MFFLGGGLALLFRWQLAYPDQPLPIIGASQQYLEEGEAVTGIDRMWERIENNDEEEWLEANMLHGIITPEFYNMLFTMHATIMVFFVVVPILVGAFGKLPHSVDDRYTRYGVSGSQYALLLARSSRRNCDDSRVFCSRRTRSSRMDRLRTPLC